MNNAQIDNTDYYKLPCGKQLEEFIFTHGLSFALGSALKYVYRAGKKDGEAKEKDMAKAGHFCKFLAGHGMDFASEFEYWKRYVDRLCDEANEWDGYRVIKFKIEE